VMDEPTPEDDEWVITFDPPAHNTPLTNRLDGVHVLDFTDITRWADGASAPRKIILLTLLSGVRDQAELLRFEPCLEEPGSPVLRLLCNRPDKSGELPHPPSQVTDDLYHELNALFGFHSRRCRFAAMLRRLADRLDPQPAIIRQAKFRMTWDGGGIDAEIKFYPSPIGDRVFITLEGGSEALGGSAGDALMETIKFQKSRQPIQDSPAEPAP
jgi:hypothetical protein